MFFTISKTFWTLAEPVNFMALCGVLGLVLFVTRFRRTGIALIGVSMVLLVAGVFSPLGSLLLRPLEDRFPRPADDAPAPTGIIVLGGGLDPDITAARGEVTLLPAGARLTAGLALARRYPQAALVFTGGSGNFNEGLSEADVVERFWRDLGLPPGRARFERKSRDTWQNATFTRDMLQPKPGEHWLLVTSAWHMPRAIGIFRQVGFDITAYPVDYWTFGDRRDYAAWHDGVKGLTRLDLAAHEWFGLLAYGIRGRTSALFPAP